MERRKNHVLVGASLCVGLECAAAAAGAASLQQVDQSEWWGNASGLPSYVNMYLYVPDQRAARPPIVVAPHHCQGTGSGTFSEMSGLVSRADQDGFVMIFPEATGQNCWDAGSDRSLQHDGKGDTHAIAQMVRYVVSTYEGNAARVYSVGGSSGGIMTEALLGVYPDVFMAGISLMGVPCGCWAEGYNDVVGKPSDGTGQWSGPCSGGNVTHSPQEWGDLVRSYFPGYTGHRPRLQHWHGTDDTVLDYANVAEDIKEWTNVLGLSDSPTGTDTPSSGTTRQYWTSPACDFTVYEVFSMSGVAHSVPFDAGAVASYFGLDDVDGEDPETVACPGAVPGGSGSGGEGGAGQAGGPGDSGGASAVGGGSVGAAGDADGGAESVTGGSGPAMGGATSAGGSEVTGGSHEVATGGSSATGGTVTTGGGTDGTGGLRATGGGVATGGSILSTGGIEASASGGAGVTGGASATSGGVGVTGGTSQGPAATGGFGVGTGGLGNSTPASGGTHSGGATEPGAVVGLGGAASSPGSSATSDEGSDGCGCVLPGRAPGQRTLATVSWIALAMLFVRRQRRRTRTFRL